MNAELRALQSIRQYAGKYPILDFIAVWCAEYVGYAMLVSVGILMAITGALTAFLSAVASGLIARFVINEGIYAVYQRRRPADLLNFRPLIKKPRHPAFPSGHAAFFGGLSIALLAYNIPLGIICIGVSAIVALARVFCGVHWPLDVVAGFGAGIVASIIVWQFT